LTLSELDQWLRESLAHGSLKRIVFVSPEASQVLHELRYGDYGPRIVQPAARHDVVERFPVDFWLLGPYGHRIPAVIVRSWLRERERMLMLDLNEFRIDVWPRTPSADAAKLQAEFEERSRL
jgi:hypothetical protein